MALVDRYIFKQLGGPFAMGLVGSLTILSFGQFLRALKFLTEGKVEAYLIFKWFIFRVPEDMQYIFPAATMMATLFVFGRLSKENELAAFLASGISLARLMVPVAVFGVLVTVGVFLFIDRAVPPSMRISQQIWEEKLRAAGPPNTVYKDNILVKSDAQQLLYLGRLVLRDGSFHNLLLREYGPTGLKTMTAAPSGRWKGDGVWTLDNPVVTRVGAGGEITTERRHAGELKLAVTPSDLQERERDINEMSIRDILEKIRRLQKRGLASTRNLQVEMYLKTAFPISALIFAFIGAAIGISPSRSGGFIGFGVSLVLTFLYYVVMSLASSLGKTGVLSPLLGSWLHNLLFLAVCVVLFLRAPAR